MTKNEINIERFTKNNKCSKQDLMYLFSKRICKNIRKYTKKYAFPSWRKVNHKMRNGKKLNCFEQRFYNDISFAIRNFTLNEDCVVYRGFSTTMKDLKIRGIVDENGDIVIGKTIFFEGLVSTSLDYSVAYYFGKKSLIKNKKNDVTIIYKIELKKEVNALPIYEISSAKIEKEILLNNISAKIISGEKKDNIIEIKIEIT